MGQLGDRNLVVNSLWMVSKTREPNPFARHDVNPRTDIKGKSRLRSQGYRKELKGKKKTRGVLKMGSREVSGRREPLADEQGQVILG